MNSFVSLLHPARPGPLPERAQKFPANDRRSEVPAPFSSLLERAARPAPRRERSEAAGESEVRGEPRDAARKKNRSRERDEPHCLAGACAVNGSPVQPETPTQPAPEVTADNPAEAGSAVSTEAEPAATPAAETGSPTGGASSGFGSAGTTVAVANAIPLGSGLAGETPTPDALADLLKPATPVTNLEPNAPVATAAGTADLVSVDPITPDDVLQPGSAKQLAATTVVNPAANALTAEAAFAAAEVPGESDALMAAASGVTEVPLSPDDARRPGRAVRRSWPEPVENRRGIGSAKLCETMKTAIKKEDIAVPLGAAQQLLPGSPAVTLPALPILPGEARVAGAGGISPADALNASAKVSPAPTRADLAGTGELLAARPATAMARISDVISREVRMFKRGGDDLVEVVLTPDAKTQISLRLQWREGQVEVQARCDLGDHQALNVQWPQLQASLAQHGVRLSHLSERAPTGFTEFFNNPNFSQQSGGDRRSAAQSGGAEPMAPSVAPAGQSGPAKPGRRGNRRLESWA